MPTRCPACGADGPAPCDACLATMRVAPAAPTPDGLDECRSLLVYEGAARAAITRMKYRNDRTVLGWLADGMAGLLSPPAGAVVTWAPTSRARRRRRGFDQAELLAVAVARRWRVPCAPLLVRAGGAAQTGRSRGERQRNPVLVARASAGHGRAVLGAAPAATAAWRAPVVVVDDVVTTGSTLSAAAAALRATGVAWVSAVTAARTPGPAALPEVRRSVPGASLHVDKSLKFSATAADDEG